MIDIRDATVKIVKTFELPTDYAMQCPADDPKSSDYYVAQADKAGSVEDLLIAHNVPTSDPIKMKLVGVQRLVDAGHGTTIAVLHRNGVLGIVGRVWGDLCWWPYVPGSKLKKGDPSIVPIWSKGYAYIDHQARTVCLRSGNSFYLYPLVDEDKLGKQIGVTISSTLSSGPSQGFATGQRAGEFSLFTMWDYGSVRDHAAVVVGEFSKGTKLYTTSARVLPEKYSRQEPEGAKFKDGVFYLGMSLVLGGEKIGALVEFKEKVKPLTTNSSALAKVVKKHGNIKALSALKLNAAIKGKYRSRYVAEVEKMLLLPKADGVWTKVVQTAFDKFRAKINLEKGLGWPVSETIGPDNITTVSLTLLRDDATTKGIATLPVVK